jgi:hypothetical protein
VNERKNLYDILFKSKRVLLQTLGYNIKSFR